MTEYCISLLNIDNEREMIQWAINNCDSFIYKTIKDVRREGYYDSFHEFYFATEPDAMWFRLYWS